MLSHTSKINRKLNPTTLSIYELRVGNIVGDSDMWVVTGIDLGSGKVQVERIFYADTDKVEILSEKKIIDETEFYGKGLWSANKNFISDETIFTEFGFYKEPSEHYSMKLERYLIRVRCDFALNQMAYMSIWEGDELVCKSELLFVHELQNAVYIVTGYHMQNELLRLTLFGKTEQKNHIKPTQPQQTNQKPVTKEDSWVSAGAILFFLVLVSFIWYILKDI